MVAALPTGGLIGRMALRAGAHRRARTLAVLTQLAAGVAAVIVVASLSASVQGFNEAELEPWRWESAAYAVDAGLPFNSDAAAAAVSSRSSTAGACTATGTWGCTAWSPTP